MALFGLFGKKKGEEELAPPEMGLGREHELGLKFPEEEEGMGAGIMPKSLSVPPGEPFGEEPASPRMMAFPQQMQPPVSVSKDLEILSAKLDALKALLESINQRLQNLERIAHGEYEQHGRYY